MYVTRTGQAPMPEPGNSRIMPKMVELKLQVSKQARKRCGRSSSADPYSLKHIIKLQDALTQSVVWGHNTQTHKSVPVPVFPANSKLSINTFCACLSCMPGQVLRNPHAGINLSSCEDCRARVGVNIRKHTAFFFVRILSFLFVGV